MVAAQATAKLRAVVVMAAQPAAMPRVAVVMGAQPAAADPRFAKASVNEMVSRARAREGQPRVIDAGPGTPGGPASNSGSTMATTTAIAAGFAAVPWKRAVSIGGDAIAYAAPVNAGVN